MLVGVPKEIKSNEKRVAIVPAGVTALKMHGHQVVIETGAGVGSGFTDESYRQAGAQILSAAEEVYEKAEMIVKVKEPLPPEYELLKKEQVLFTFLHLSAEPALADTLLTREVTGIAYETITSNDGSLPLLTPMSEVAGRMATQIGARLLEVSNGGKGVLMGGVPGVNPAQVTILGGGVVGKNAAKIAVGMGADVTILDIRAEQLRYVDDVFEGRIKTFMSNSYNLENCLKRTDLLIGAVLIPGAKAPNLVTEDMVKKMPEGSVIVDVAIDQGGSVETIDRITTHENPTYIKHGVVHYAVANIPGAVPRTSTLALTNVTLPYVIRLANLGWEKACSEDKNLAAGVNTVRGVLTNQAVAGSLEKECFPLEKCI